MATLEQISVLKLRGEVTMADLPSLQAAMERLAGQPEPRIVVDLSDVDLLTTPAISLFIEVAKRLRGMPGRLVFTQAHPPVCDMLSRLRLHEVLRTVAGVNEAIEDVRG